MRTTKRDRFDHRLARAVARELYQRGWRPLSDGSLEPPRGLPEMPERVAQPVWQFMCELDQEPPAGRKRYSVLRH